MNTGNTSIDMGEDSDPNLDNTGNTVIEAKYREQLDTCDHPNCNRSSSGSNRLCGRCVNIMLPNTPDECDFCGAEI